MPHAEVTLPGLTSSVPTARRFVESVLSGWDHPELGWDAAMCVSELAANCALHARTTFTVRVELAGDVVRVEVSDGSTRIPSQRSYADESTTGRGLRLVGEYSTSWGVDLHEAGKTVWLLLSARSSDDGDRHEDADDISVDALLASYADDVDGPASSSRAALLWRTAA